MRFSNFAQVSVGNYLRLAQICVPPFIVLMLNTLRIYQDIQNQGW